MLTVIIGRSGERRPTARSRLTRSFRNQIGIIKASGMKEKVCLFFGFLSLFFQGITWADTGSEEMRYRRNSMYSIVVVHPDEKFAGDIFSEFSKLSVPDKFNDHNLSVVGLKVKKKGNHRREIDDFIEKNKIASRMVAKWFNRDPRTGVCDMELIKARGLYDASEFDKELAAHSVRGTSLLQDAGEDLISNTYLLVNEVSYVDKEKVAKIAAGTLIVIAALAGAAADISSYSNNRSTGGSGLAMGLMLGTTAGAVLSTYKGFRVRIISRLYQLEWDEETADMFYGLHYTDKPDASKCQQFEKDRNKYKLRYLGQVVSKGSETSFLGINEDHPQMMVRKACQRAIDENIVDLQHAFEQFRVKSPIMKIKPTLEIPIGKKEGVNKESKYEVMEVVEHNGRMTYERVAVIMPKPDKIWDNRFMAQEEQAEGAFLGTTTFHKVSGKEISVGMLVREII